MKKKNLVLLLSGIVVILVGVVISFFIKNGIPVNANGKTVKELYSYVGNSDLEKCGGLVFYNDSKVDYNSLSNDTKICLAYTQVKKEVKEKEEVSVRKEEQEIKEKEESEKTDDLNIVFNYDEERDNTPLNIITDTKKEVFNDVTSDTYTTYIVYLVNETDTIDSICNKYKINKEKVYDYNDIKDIKCGMKLVLPDVKNEQ